MLPLMLRKPIEAGVNTTGEVQIYQGLRGKFEQDLCTVREEEVKRIVVTSAQQVTLATMWSYR